MKKSPAEGVVAELGVADVESVQVGAHLEHASGRVVVQRATVAEIELDNIGAHARQQAAQPEAKQTNFIVVVVVVVVDHLIIVVVNVLLAGIKEVVVVFAVVLVQVLFLLSGVPPPVDIAQLAPVARVVDERVPALGDTRRPKAVAQWQHAHNFEHQFVGKTVDTGHRCRLD